MKKFLVIKDYCRNFTPYVVRQFDNWEDANTYASLCNKSDQHGLLYYVFEMSDRTE
jgi:hypothetical protein